MIRRLLQRSPVESVGTHSVQSLNEEVDRLRSQNEKLRLAMRHCTDCEYRIEVMAARAGAGVAAAGGGEQIDPGRPGGPAS